MHSLSTSAVGGLADAYRRNRERSRALFDLLAEEAYYSRPIDVRHPIVFYDGHLPGRDLSAALASRDYQAQIGEFILPYDAVRTSGNPAEALREFINSTYDRAAPLAK